MVARIMVIDDDQSTRELYNFLLTDEGYENFGCAYNDVTLTEIQRLQPDLIIMEINMHQENVGWTLLQLLRMEDTTASIPVLVSTTANRLSQEIEHYLLTRRMMLLHKPFSIDALFQMIVKALLLEQAEPLIYSNPDWPVLVVEDDGLLRRMLNIVLSMEGYQCVSASNGAEALDAVTRTHYSLILLDIAMPVMNGLEFLTAYAGHPEVHTPVIIISGETSFTRDVLPSFVMDIVSKPFDLTDLLMLINKHAQPA